MKLNSKFKIQFFQLSCFVLFLGLTYAQDRPNVLWITAEDMSPTLGCYGDKDAISPNIDRLSEKSLVYTRAFSTAPVCSPSRSCLINGLPATSQGTHNMRSAYTIPSFMTGFPALLRKAGYFTSNNVKTDYNSALWKEIIEASWDRQGDTAHWRDRKSDRPFFSIFNLMTSHQSRSMVWAYDKFEDEVQSKVSLEHRHNPKKIHLPVYYPDTPVVRKTVARFYDCVTAMDAEVGAILKQLKQDGLDQDTIVFFYSDHGSGMPRHKRALLESGMRVPLMVHFPEKWKHLAPEVSVGNVGRLVNFADFGPTVLNLLGLDIPTYMEGKPFLGQQSEHEKNYVFGHRDRVDEVIDFARSVRSKKFLYIKNYMPYLGYNQRTAWPDLGEIRHEFYKLEGKASLNAAQKHFIRSSRAVEELYDCEKDPNNLYNLATDSNYQIVLEEMRKALKQKVMTTKDLGYLPEPMLWDLSEKSTLYDFARRDYPLEEIYAAATKVGMISEEEALEGLSSSHAAVRYWSCVALRALPVLSEKTKLKLRSSLKDPSIAVKIQIAENLAYAGELSKVKHIYKEALAHDNMSAVQYAARSIENLGSKAKSLYKDMLKTDQRMKAIRPPGTSPVVVQPGRVDMAMFVSFSTEAFLKKQSPKKTKGTLSQLQENP
jgi:arylsulfatase A-like enzyme